MFPSPASVNSSGTVHRYDVISPGPGTWEEGCELPWEECEHDGDENAFFTYRARVLPKLPPGYDGANHLLMLLCAGLVGLALPFSSWFADGRGASRDVALIPITIFACHLFEYTLNRLCSHHQTHRIAAELSRLPLVRPYESRRLSIRGAPG